MPWERLCLWISEVAMVAKFNFRLTNEQLDFVCTKLGSIPLDGVTEMPTASNVVSESMVPFYDQRWRELKALEVPWHNRSLPLRAGLRLARLLLSGAGIVCLTFLIYIGAEYFLLFRPQSGTDVTLCSSGSSSPGAS